MTINKPEVVAWWDGESSITRNVGRPAAHSWHQRIDLIRLSDYESLQAECEELRKDAERYRWLSSGGVDDMPFPGSWGDKQWLDAAIDDAMEGDKP